MLAVCSAARARERGGANWPFFKRVSRKGGKDRRATQQREPARILAGCDGSKSCHNPTKRSTTFLVREYRKARAQTRGTGTGGIHREVIEERRLPPKTLALIPALPPIHSAAPVVSDHIFAHTTSASTRACRSVANDRGLSATEESARLDHRQGRHHAGQPCESRPAAFECTALASVDMTAREPTAPRWTRDYASKRRWGSESGG